MSKPTPMYEDSPYSPRCGKVSHPSRRVAVASLYRVKQGLDGDGKDRGPLHVYPCSKCGGWHLGNNNDGERHAHQEKNRRRRQRRERRTCIEEDE